MVTNGLIKALSIIKYRHLLGIIEIKDLIGFIKQEDNLRDAFQYEGANINKFFRFGIIAS